jgi:hypothetical protein
VLKKNTRYPRSSLFLRGMMGSVYQTATEDPKTPSAKVIFLDSTSGVTEARSGDISERWVISREVFEAYSNDERLTVFHLCSLRLSSSSLSLVWTSAAIPAQPRETGTTLFFFFCAEIGLRSSCLNHSSRCCSHALATRSHHHQKFLVGGSSAPLVD